MKINATLNMQGNDIQRCSIEKVSSLPSTNNFIGRIVCLVTPGVDSNPDTCMYFYYDEKGWFPFNNVVIDDTKINVIEGYNKVRYFSTISDAATYIKSNTNLKSVIIGENAGITTIGNNAFTYCRISSIILPNGITSIGDYAFHQCINLSNISIPNTVTTIGKGAFSYCTSLLSMYIPNNVTTISEEAFNSCLSLSYIYLINATSLTTIGKHAFWKCSSIKYITIPNNVTSIAECAFRNCYSLVEVTLPNGLTSINGSMFQNCYNLTTINIPSSVTTIDNYAFQNCSSLKNITLPNGLTSIGASAFDSVGFTSITIPDTVTTIGNYAFANCTSLTSVTLSSGIVNYGIRIFHLCKALTSVNFNGSTIIGDYEFANCTALTSITIPDTITNIGTAAFFNCDILALAPYKNKTGYPWGANNIKIFNENVTNNINENSTDRQVPTAKAIYDFTRPIFGTRYGFRINKNNSDPDTRVEYLYEAVGMIPAKMTYDETTHKGTFDYGSWSNVWFIKNNRPVKLNFNGTVEAELNPNNYWETIDGLDSELETSTDCNFMSEIPIVYVKRWEDKNYNYVVVCDKQYDEDYLAYANTDKDGNLKPLYAPIFKGYKDSNDILRSIAGVDPLNNAITSDEVMYSNNINTAGSVTGWQIEDISKHELISDLLTLISKNTDSQTIFGNGVCNTTSSQTSTRIFTGYNEEVTDTKTTKSDCGQFCGYNDNTHHVSIFHIQDFWGNILDRCLGLISYDSKYYYKMTPENGGYTYTGNISDYINNGYTVAQDYSGNDIALPAGGYIKNQSTGIFGNLPINTTGASDSTYYCDYCWNNYNSELRIILLGGRYGSGSYSGARAFNMNFYASSGKNSYIGASPFYV